jgi:AcrR family transcriptional regulator
MVDLPGYRASYHHGDLRAALTQAAMDQAGAGGPATVTVRGVARRVGVTAPAVYRHFSTLDKLLAAVKDLVLTMLSEVLEGTSRTVGTVGGRHGGRDRSGHADPVSAAVAGIHAVAWDYTAFARERPGLYALACYGGVDAPQSVLLDGLRDHLEALTAAGVMTAAVRPGADLALWSVVHSLAGLMADGALRAEPEAEQRARLAEVLDVVVAGLVGPVPVAVGAF